MKKNVKRILPPFLKLNARDTQAWIVESFRFGARGLANGDPGTATIMARMSELLFVKAVRRHLTTMRR